MYYATKTHYTRLLQTTEGSEARTARQAEAAAHVRELRCGHEVVTVLMLR